MHRVPLAALAAAALFAQSPGDVFRKAPPALDKPLRERITLFYQHHIDAKYRLAEDLVAEDSKNIYYTSQKPKVVKFQIRTIEYSEKFTKANVTVVADMYVPVPGFDRPLPVPQPSTWKLVNGQWFWYIDPAVLNKTPFGEVKSDPNAKVSPPPPVSSRPSLGTLMNSVAADKNEVELRKEKGAEGQVRVSNKMPGSVQVRTDLLNIPGLEVTIAPASLKANEDATVTIRVTDPDLAAKQPGVGLVVDPIGKFIPVRLKWVSGS